MLLQLLEHGDEESRGLAGAGPGHGDDVGAGEDEGHGLALDRGGDPVPLALDPAEHVGAEAEGLEPARPRLLLPLLPPLQLRLRAHVELLLPGHWSGPQLLELLDAGEEEEEGSSNGFAEPSFSSGFIVSLSLFSFLFVYGRKKRENNSKRHNPLKNTKLQIQS